MSLEASMLVLAESQNTLAAAMTRYANVMEAHLASNGVAVAQTDTTSAAANTDAGSTTEKTPGKRRTKAEIADAAKADVKAQAAAASSSTADPFGDDSGNEEADPFADDAAPAAKVITKEDIRALVIGVKEKNEGHAKKLLEALGVKTLGTIAEKDYPRVVELAAKCGVTL